MPLNLAAVMSFQTWAVTKIVIAASGMTAVGFGVLFLDKYAIEKDGHNDDGGGLLKRSTSIFQAEALPEVTSCTTDFKAANITITGLEDPRSFRADGVPSACMDLARISPDGDDLGTMPTECGSDCLLYENLADDELAMFQSILMYFSV